MLFFDTARMHHNRSRHVRLHTSLQQCIANHGDAAHAHVDDERRPAADQCRPVGVAIVARMRRDKGHAMAMPAMRQRNAKRLRSRQTTADAVDDLHFDAMVTQELGFLAAAAKQQRIAALDARHASPGLRMGKRLCVNTCLAHRATPAALAD